MGVVQAQPEKQQQKKSEQPGLLTERLITDGVRVSAPASTKEVLLIRGAMRSSTPCDGLPSMSKACSCAME